LNQTKHGVQQIGKQFSTTSTSEHALLQAMLAGLIHTFQAILSSILRVIRSQQRCNPDSRKDDAYTSISIKFANWRGWWRRPCVECAFYSYTRNGFVTGAKQL
jgi:hypothetical protein